MTNLGRRARALAVVAAVIGTLPGCGAGGPAPQVYVLGDAAAADPVAVSQLHAPAVEVRPVRVPDYLDTTDIVTRGAGGLIVPSPSGRWGERLSIGLARDVAARLADRFPQFAVTASPPLDEPRWQIRIEFEAFDVLPGEGSTLAARWSVADGKGRPVAEERVVLTATDPALRTDAQIVAAMGGQVAELAQRIAASMAPFAESTSGPATRSAD